MNIDGYIIDIDGVVEEPAAVEQEQEEVKTEEATGQEEGKAEEAEGEAEKETEEQGEEERPKKKSGIQRLKEKNARLEQELDFLKRQTTSKPEQEQPRKEGAPNPNDYEDQASYIEALTDYKVQKAIEEKERATAEARQRETWSQKLNEVHRAHPDLGDLLEDLVSEGIPVTEAMDSAFKESEHGGELLYYVASHPEECAKIAKLSPKQQLMAMGRIESILAQPKRAEVQPKQVTKAPKPPVPVTASVIPTQKDKDGYELF